MVATPPGPGVADEEGTQVVAGNGSEAKDGMRNKNTQDKHLPANPARYVYTCMRQCMT